MYKLLIVSLLVSMVAFIGCATYTIAVDYQPTPDEIATADYGGFPSDYQQIIKDFMQTRLKDPYSAQYRFDREPHKSYVSASTRERTIFCYRESVHINAKNSYGGYTGEHDYSFYIRDGEVIDYIDFSK